MNDESNIISHGSSESKSFREITDVIHQKANRGLVPLEDSLRLLHGLNECELGRFLLSNRGLNGRWTQYLVLHPVLKSQLSSDGSPLGEMEKWFLIAAPAALATQERFQIFQAVIQERVQSNMTLASLPCGRMDDLLRLDYRGKSNVTLVGIDLDDETLFEAAENASLLSPGPSVKFLKRDGWELDLDCEFDLITSNGLNIYEFNEERIVQLYKRFFSALKPGGILVTSVMTPPPGLTGDCIWDFSKINMKDLQLQKILFADLLEVKWQAYTQPEQATAQLMAAGFSNVAIRFDRARIFPTIVAQK